jgi:hypothetical protein
MSLACTGLRPRKRRATGQRHIMLRKQMNLDDLTPAIEKINSSPAVNELRAVTYLWTYPSIRAIADGRSEINICVFHQLATATYGWMPRVVRIDPTYVQSALEAVNQALAVRHDTISEVDVMSIAECLHSLVGASKVLHFVNPTVFPIWDSRIEGLRLGRKPSQIHMDNPEKLYSYISNVHEILQDERFSEFHRDFQLSFERRLLACHIPPYTVSEVRAVEYSALVLTET